MTFKEQMEKTFIPSIENMLDKEKEHCKKLIIIGVNNESAKYFAIESRKYISFLEKRLEEYKEYLKKL